MAMSDRLLDCLGVDTSPRDRLRTPPFDQRRIDGCLRALGIVGLTLVAGLFLLLVLALGSADGLRDFRLAKAPHPGHATHAPLESPRSGPPLPPIGV
jgi:hypothetical protein